MLSVLLIVAMLTMITMPVFATTYKTITASAGAGGTITPSGVVYVQYNHDKTFTVQADTGYYVATVVVDGELVTDTGYTGWGSTYVMSADYLTYYVRVLTYEFKNVRADHTISVTFGCLIGPQGPAGPQGEQGIQGIQGETGEQGPQGIQGETGPQGEQGIQGVNGEDGQDGATWIVGLTIPDGELGRDGDLYLQTTTYNVYIKVEGEWSLIGCIQGPRGYTGATGADGADGKDGVDGAQGIQGIQGEVGPMGPMGPIGVGIQGLTGPEGPQGLQGETGPVGPAGADGQNGIDGVDGIDGKDGVDGKDGISAVVDATAVGSSGVDVPFIIILAIALSALACAIGSAIALKKNQNDLNNIDGID